MKMDFKRFVIAWRKFLRNANGHTGRDISLPALFLETKKEVFMPRGDGTGPTGAGPGTGRGIGQGAGQGSGRGAGQGSGRGRMGGRGLGIGGECLCPQCGTRAPHERGVPCAQQKCPQCGTAMVRA